MIEEVKEWHPDFVSRMTFSAELRTKVYVVETFIDGNFFKETDVDARTGENYESIGSDASSGIREDSTYGPLTDEEYYKDHNITINDTDSFEEDESIENGT